MKRPCICLCMIVLNGEATLPRCLESVAGGVDEIVVAVDSRTTDRTRDIAREYGAKVVDFEWADDFSAARRESYRHASGEWILILDVDEWLDDGAARSLRELVASAAPETAGYRATVETRANNDPFAGWRRRRESFCRLFRRQPEAEVWGRITDEITPVIESLGRVPDSPLLIHHLHDLTPEQWRRKWERNVRLMEMQLAEEPTRGHLWNALANHYRAAGGLKDAAEAYQKALDPDNRAGPIATYVATAWCSLGTVTCGRGDLATGSRHFLRAAAVDPMMPDPHAYLGVVALTRQRWNDAERHFRDAAARVGSDGDDEGTPSWLPSIGLMAARQRLSAQAYLTLVAARARGALVGELLG